MSESVEALGERMRKTLDLYPWRDNSWLEAHSLLDVLLARLAEAEERIANYERYVEREIEPKLLARLAEAEKDRDKWKALYGEIGARMARYRDALERLRMTMNLWIIPVLDQNEVVSERDRARLLDAIYAADSALDPE